MRLIGTGKDPLNRYAKGVAYDLPDEDEQAIAEPRAGLGTHPNEDETPPTAIQLAHAVLRGDNLLIPEEAQAADKLRDRAHAIAHEDDPGAPKEAAAPPLAAGCRTWTRVKKPPLRKRQRLQ